MARRTAYGSERIAERRLPRVLRGSGAGGPSKQTPARVVSPFARPLVVVGLLFAASCVPRKLPDERYSTDVVTLDCCERVRGRVDLTYLGVGGWLIRTERSSLLTAPLFSNPTFFEAGLDEIHVDPDRIEQNLPDVSDVSAILVGHGHYDHLMDVPWIVEHRAPGATVYGNRTSGHQLAPLGYTARRPDEEPPASRDLVLINESAGTAERAGRWIEAGPGVRFMPLLSDHAPHFAGNVLFSGVRDRDMVRAPLSANEWLDGETYAFLIDFLDDDENVALRVYYQDAVAAAPFGFMPPLDDGVPVDLALIVPATYAEVVWHPEALLANLRPEHVILGHWENFFLPPSRQVEPVPFTLLPDFVRRLERALPDGVAYDLPLPGTHFVILPPEGG